MRLDEPTPLAGDDNSGRDCLLPAKAQFPQECFARSGFLLSRFCRNDQGYLESLWPQDNECKPTCGMAAVPDMLPTRDESGSASFNIEPSFDFPCLHDPLSPQGPLFASHELFSDFQVLAGDADALIMGHAEATAHQGLNDQLLPRETLCQPTGAKPTTPASPGMEEAPPHSNNPWEGLSALPDGLLDLGGFQWADVANDGGSTSEPLRQGNMDNGSGQALFAIIWRLLQMASST